MENLKSRFKKIYLNYDNDAPGLNYTNNLTKVYNFLIPLFVPEQKDISDYIDYKKDKNIVKNEISKKLV
jgi:DNA primase